MFMYSGDRVLTFQRRRRTDEKTGNSAAIMQVDLRTPRLITGAS